MTDKWEAGAEYWKNQHRELVATINKISWGPGDEDTLRRKLHALHCEVTAGRRCSPVEAEKLADWFEKQDWS